MRPMMYRIGDRMPREGTGLLGGPMQHGPAWFIFRTPPLKEGAAQAWLRRNGALDAWFPTVVEWVPTRGARRRKVAQVRRVAPGYVFAYFDREPRWHVLFEAARGRVSRVVDLGGLPLAIPDRVIAQMQHVPARVAALHAKAEQDRLRAWLAKQPVPGQEARVTAGPLAGLTVRVEEIHGGLAACLAWGFRKVKIEATTLERRT